MQVQGAPRQDAAAKDSKWVRQRQALEESKPADVNEILLASSGTHPTTPSLLQPNMAWNVYV